MFLVVSRFLIPKGFGGITVFPFVIVATRRHVSDRVFVNHEKIHIRQQLELLVLPFFIWYAVEYFIKRAKYKSKNTAYKAIGFEREAYANEHDLDYPGKRRFWGFLKYV